MAKKTKNERVLGLEVVNLHPDGFKVLEDGYKFELHLFRLATLFIIFVSVMAVVKYGINTKYYVNCPESAVGGRCTNPLYGECEGPACEQEYLWPGQSFGEKPEAVYLWAVPLMIASLVIAGLVNHFKNNPRFAR